MKMTKPVLLLCVLLIGTALSLRAGNAVWWEGEDVLKSDFVPSDRLAKPAKPTRLSNRKWLNCFIPADAEKRQKSYSAQYEINVPADSEYTFWAREFYRHTASPWKFRFDNGPWVQVAKDQEVLDVSGIGKNISVVWCKYNKIKLTKGKHKFELEISEKPEKKGFCSGFDCFLLTDVPFTPNEWQKPKVLAQYGYIGTYIWLEGENAESDFETTVPGIPASSPKLSNKKWLICSSAADDAPAGGFTAKLKFIAPVGDIYHVWMRELTKKLESPFQYRFNNAKKWKKALPSAASFDNVRIDKETSVCWVNYGKSYLNEGENTLEIRLLNPNKNDEFKLAIDAVCLSLQPFTPAGSMKPDTKIIPPKGWRAFRPGDDSGESRKDNVISLRYLNEKRSGSHGFCKVTKKGLVFKDGTRVKFWGVNAYAPMKMDSSSVDAFTARMADAGVNLIRIDGPLTNFANEPLGTVDKDLFDKLCYFISACKDNGIYVALALYSPDYYLLDAKSGFAGYTKPAHPYGMLYINEKFRNRYKKWASFLKRVNPYTKLKLNQDPTIVWFEIENGDGIFSDRFNSIPRQQKDLLDDEYNKWLVKKHGGIQETLHAWNMPNKYHPVLDSDGLRSGRPRYRILSPDTFKPEILTNVNSNYMNKRKMDQLRFLIQYCRTINKELILFLKQECRFKGLISVGNSSTAVPEILDPALSYIYASGEIMARTSTFEAKILNNVETLTDKIFFRSKSVIKNPLASPLVAPSFIGKANVITSVSWPLPNEFRAEAVPFTAAYAALHGSDTYIWYNADSPLWATRLKKYTIQGPAVMGEFPGYALMFRRGDIAAGKTFISSQLGLPDITGLKGNKFSIEQFQDKLKLTDIPDMAGKINPLACFAGKVDFSLDREKSIFLQDKEMDKYIDSEKGIVKSSTGELKINYSKGYMSINSSKAQGVTGFFTADIAKKLKDVVITFNNRYGTILVISLDGKKIAKSKHILIQSFSKESNYKWETSSVVVKGEKLKRLDSIGNSPLIVQKINGTVAFPKIKPAGWKGWKLNVNGKRISPLKLNSGRYLKMALPADSFYVELLKK